MFKIHENALNYLTKHGPKHTANPATAQQNVRSDTNKKSWKIGDFTDYLYLFCSNLLTFCLLSEFPMPPLGFSMKFYVASRLQLPRSCMKYVKIYFIVIEKTKGLRTSKYYYRKKILQKYRFSYKYID